MVAATETGATQDYARLARKELDDFLVVTAVKGLQFLKYSAHWSESIFWTLLLLAGTTLAVRDVCRICDEFANEETYAKMVLINNHRLAIDMATICVDYDPRFINTSNPELIRSAKMTNADELLGDRFNVSEVTLLERALKLLTVVSLLEIGRSVDYETKMNAMLANTDELRELHDSLRQQNVSYAALSRVVGEWLCLAAHVQIEIFSRGQLSRAIDACDNTTISWLGVIPFISTEFSETTFCVDVGGRITFESTMDSVLLRVNTDAILPTATSSTEESPASGANDYAASAYFDVTGDPVSTDMSKDWIQFPNRGCASIELAIDAELRLLDRRVARCDPQAKTLLACYGHCEVLRYESVEACNCSQATWSYQRNPTRRPSCFYEKTIEEQHGCRRAVHRMNVSDACLRACLIPCALRQYSIVSRGQCLLSVSRRDAALELAPKRFTVPVFDEEFTVSISGLFSRLGGTFGLWLGVGMIGICHACLFPVKLFMRCLQHRWKEQQFPAPIQSVQLQNTHMKSRAWK